MRRLWTLALVTALFSWWPLTSRPAEPNSSTAADGPVVKVIAGPEPTEYTHFRRAVIGPGLNQPQPYPGYQGFVGWAGMTRTATGALLITFSSGYWHASPPTGPQLLPADFVELFRKLSGADIASINAPRGGRAEIIRSEDGGLTWSSPEVMIDTPLDDRSPSAVRLSDGTLVASFFTSDGTVAQTAIIRSFDDGKTWEQTPRYLESSFKDAGTNGPPLELPDKSVILSVYGEDNLAQGTLSYVSLFRSHDRGATWSRRGSVKASFDVNESSVARLHDGRLMVIARPEGAVAWSRDEGETWTTPVRLPFRMFDPWLLTLGDGTLLCFHGSYTKGKHGLRVIISRDGGKTWFAAGPDFGFTIDPTVYGYSRGVPLPDGSILLVYQGAGGHKWEDARTMSLYCLRIRVRKGGRGIDLLPAPGVTANGKS